MSPNYFFTELESYLYSRERSKISCCCCCRDLVTGGANRDNYFTQCRIRPWLTKWFTPVDIFCFRLQPKMKEKIVTQLLKKELGSYIIIHHSVDHGIWAWKAILIPTVLTNLPPLQSSFVGAFSSKNGKLSGRKSGWQRIQKVFFTLEEWHLWLKW